MASVLVRNIAMIGGMLLAGMACVRAAPALQSVRGEYGPTIFAAESPLIAAIAVGGGLMISTGIAVIVAKLVNAAVGLFVLGAGAFALTGRLSGLREAAFSGLPSTSLTAMAIEALLLALLTLGLVLIVFKCTGGFRDVEPQVDGTRPHWLWSDAAIKSAAAGLVVLPTVWIIAQSSMKGQAVAAAFLGAMIAGMIGRLVAPHVQPILGYVSSIVAGSIGYVIASVMSSSAMDQAYIAGTASAFAKVMPLDYVAGSLMGASFGLGWARSFLHHEETGTAPAAMRASS